MPVTLPVELQAIIAGFIVFLVTEGLKSLGALIKIDLSGAAAGIAAAIVGLIVALVNGFLIQIPPEFADVARSILSLLIVILGAFGVHRTFKRIS